jgi:hypothetical protein
LRGEGPVTGAEEYADGVVGLVNDDDIEPAVVIEIARHGAARVRSRSVVNRRVEGGRTGTHVVE